MRLSGGCRRFFGVVLKNIKCVSTAPMVPKTTFRLGDVAYLYRCAWPRANSARRYLFLSLFPCGMFKWLRVWFFGRNVVSVFHLLNALLILFTVYT